MLLNNTVTLIVMLFHILYSFTFVLFATFSNNINLLICILICCLLIKYSFYRFGYCLITPLEKNDTLNSSITNFGSIIVNKFTERQIEEISHNIILIFIIIKLFVLMFCKYYKINISKFLKNSIDTIF